MEFGKLHAGTDDNYFDFLEDNLLAWDIVAYELVSNNRSVSYTHLRAHETDQYLVCRLLLEKK